MDVTTAIAAGDLAQRIRVRQDAMAMIQAALTDKWSISKLNAVNPENGNEVSLILEKLDDATSEQCLSFALAIYQGQVDELSKQLEVL